MGSSNSFNQDYYSNYLKCEVGRGSNKVFSNEILNPNINLSASDLNITSASQHHGPGAQPTLMADIVNFSTQLSFPQHPNITKQPNFITSESPPNDDDSDVYGDLSPLTSKPSSPSSIYRNYTLISSQPRLPPPPEPSSTQLEEMVSISTASASVNETTSVSVSVSVNDTVNVKESPTKRMNKNTQNDTERHIKKRHKPFGKIDAKHKTPEHRKEHKIKAELSSISNEDIEKYNRVEKVVCFYCKNSIKEIDACRYKGEIICEKCGREKINNGEIRNFQEFEDYIDDKEYEDDEDKVFDCVRLQHYKPKYSYLTVLKKNDSLTVNKNCCYCSLIKHYENEIKKYTNKTKTPKIK